MSAHFTAILARMKREVLEEVRAGRIPATAADFSELHDYLDANELGGACEDDCPVPVEDVEFWDSVQGAVNAWIIAGGLLEAGV